MNKGKFDGILICSDIDNTLFYHLPKSEEGFVAENACKAIKYFQENGGRFTLATGRFPWFAGKELSEYITPNAPLIALNGSMIYDTEKKEMLFSSPINDDILRLSFDVIEKYPSMRRISLQCGGGSYSFKRQKNGGYIYSEEFVDSPILHSIHTREEFAEIIKNEDVYKVLYVVPTKNSKRIKDTITAAFPEYAVARSWINGIELQNASADKGKSARRLAEMLGDVRLLVCVGDYENDLSMIKEADIGYAVQNALPSIKKEADRVTTLSSKYGAIAEIIEQLEKEFAIKE